MSRLSKITIAIAGIWLLVFSAFAARPAGVIQLFLLVLTLGLMAFGLISFVRGFMRWRHERWRSMIPVGACVLAVVLAAGVAAPIRIIMLQRSLPHYRSIIHQMESGRIPVSGELRRIREAEGGLTYAVLAQRSTNGVLIVEFLTGGGFPVKHSGYLYCSSGVIENGSLIDSRWPKRREVRPSWFLIAD